MAELSSITKHFKKGKPHHTVVQFTDGNKFWEHAISAKDKVRVFDDERFLFIDGCCIPFPEECKNMTYMGLLGICAIFVSSIGFVGERKMVAIIPATPQPIISIDSFRSYWRHREDSKHPVIRKLLEVNNAKEIYIFNGIREEGTKGSKMFAVDYDDKVSEIEFEVLIEQGGIDRLLRTEEPPNGYEYISRDAVLGINERDTFFLGEINPFKYQYYIEKLEEKLIVCGPNDVTKPGVLYWQII